VLNREVTDASPWLTEQLDLGAYLRRIGARRAAPSRAALDALHEAHVRAFSFDNIDVLLDQHPGVRWTRSRRSSSVADEAGTASSTPSCSRRHWSGWATTWSGGWDGSGTPPRRGRTALSW